MTIKDHKMNLRQVLSLVQEKVRFKPRSHWHQKPRSHPCAILHLKSYTQRIKDQQSTKFKTTY